MKNILFITYKTNPIKGTGSIRSSKLAKYVSKEGYNPFVISTSNYRLFHQENYLINSHNTIKFFRLPTLDYQTIKYIMIKIINLFKRKTDKFYTIELTNKHFLFYLFSLFPLNLLIGEGGIIYIMISIYISLYLINRYKIKYIFSSFSPISDHVIAWFLKILKPNLIWVADFRDLHIERIKEFGFHSSLFLNLNILVDKTILAKDNALTCISKGLSQHLKKYNSNVYVIRNGFDLDEMNQNKQKRINHFSFLYAGALYEGKRDPSILLECLNNLISMKKINKKNIKLLYAGREDTLFNKFCSKYNLSHIYNNLGYISREKAIEAERSSFFLIMLTWASAKEKGVMTAKFYEYLASGRIIICIVNGERDEELDDIFNKTNCGILIYSNEKSCKKKLSNFILKQYKKYQLHDFQNDYNWEEVYKFSYENLSKKLLNVFKKN